MSRLLTARHKPLTLADPPRGGSARRQRWWLVASLTSIVATRALLSVVARQSGFIEYNADGFARSVHAAAWARAPHLEVGVWLPLQFWVMGAALRVWPDLLVTPVAINFVVSLASAVLLAAIGARLGGRATGWLAGLLAAAFPWSIWFGLSGLVDGPFATVVVGAGLGLVGWLRDRRDANLWLAGGALLAGTMLRYEGWFYAVALAGIVLAQTPPAEWLRPRRIVPLALPFLFPAFWVGASLLAHGDPFAFAHMTSDITAAEGTHLELSPIERLVFYPLFFITLVWPVVWSGLLGAAWRWRQPAVAGYTLWVLTELAVLALITSRFAGIGAGRDRYIMSTVVLMLPLSALLITSLWQRAGWGRVLATAALALVLGFSITTLLGREHVYPARDTVALAAALRAGWAAGSIPPDAIVPVEVGQPGDTDGLYNESYALQVLTNRPTSFHFFWNLDLFNRVVADQTPLIWVSDDRLPNPARPRGQQVQRIGHYAIHQRPPPPQLRTPATAWAGGALTLTGDGFQPDEVVGLWLTAPDGRTIDLGQGRSDASGRLVAEVRLPSQLTGGDYMLSARGARFNTTGHARLTVER